MKKTLNKLLWTTIIGISSVATPMLANAGSFNSNLHGSKLNVADGEQNAGNAFLDFVQNWVNWVLGILWLITVVILIWWGFLMVTAAGDDTKYKKGFTIVKQASIWLILIGVSWLIVSLIFSFVWSTADNATNSNNPAVSN